jgi:regulator of replication initiation timing
MSNILTPVDMTEIMTSITKLKSALSEVTTRNAQLAMQNNELIHELSFMPPAMREKIVQARNLKDPGRGSPDKAPGMFFIPNHKRCRL